MTSNAATDVWKAAMGARPVDAAGFEADLRRLLADDFVRVDLRQLVALPRATRDEFVAQAVITHFEFDVVPHTETDEVLAVIGDRLGLVGCRLVYDDTGQIEYLAVLRFDEPVERLERMVVFDVAAVDAARAELDRLAGQLAGPDEMPG